MDEGWTTERKEWKDETGRRRMEEYNEKMKDEELLTLNNETISSFIHTNEQKNAYDFR